MAELDDIAVNLDDDALDFAPINPLDDNGAGDDNVELDENGNPITTNEPSDNNLDDEPVDDDEPTDDNPSDEPDNDNSDDDKSNDNPTDEPSFIKGLFEELGIEPVDENGQPLEFEETQEGLQQATQYSANVLAEQRLDNYFESNPEVYKYALHIKNGGTPDSYFKRPELGIPDVSGLEITEETPEEQLSSVYGLFLKLKGFDADDIKDHVELAIDKGQLKDKAEKAKNAIVDFRAKKEQEFQNKLEAANKQKQEESAALWKEVDETIKTGKILGTQLSKKEQQEFKDYFLKPNAQGVTLKQQVENELTVEQELFLEYLKFKKFQNVMKPDTKTIKNKTIADVYGNRKSQKVTGKGGKNSGSGDKIDNTNSPIELEFSLEDI